MILKRQATSQPGHQGKSVSPQKGSEVSRPGVQKIHHARTTFRAADLSRYVRSPPSILGPPSRTSIGERAGAESFLYSL